MDLKNNSHSDKEEKNQNSVLVCIDDYEHRARSKLSKSIYDYYRGGADDEFTLNRNVEAFKKLLIRPRFLRNVSSIDLKVHLLDGTLKLSSPICIAPTASQKMAHPDGELATVRAASKMGTIMIASTIATTSLERIAQECPNAIRWFQLYIFKNRAASKTLIKRVEKAGYSALVLTIDTPVCGQRRDDVRNAFALPPNLRMENFENEPTEELAKKMNVQTKGESGFAHYVNTIFDGSIKWSTIDWLRSITNLPIILKGIMTAEDALEACRNHGIQGIIVSNHGARQLDYAPSTIEALPEVVEAVGDRCEIYLDGGVRSGSSVFKALALGAKAVFIGRPILWGLATQGEKGVHDVLNLLNQELRRTMALAGCSNLDEIIKTPNLVVHENYFSRL